MPCCSSSLPVLLRAVSLRLPKSMPWPQLSVSGKARLDLVVGKSIVLVICGAEFCLCSLLTGSFQANHPSFSSSLAFRTELKIPQFLVLLSPTEQVWPL